MGDQPAPPDDDRDDRDDPESEAGDGGTPPPVKIQPVKERIGEGADNLRRRQSWFRKRTTDSE